MKSTSVVRYSILVLLPAFLVANLAAITCPGTDVAVNLSSPSGSGTLASPARFTATAATSQGTVITGYDVYTDAAFDGAPAYENDNSPTLDAWVILPLAADGSAQPQTVFVRAWDDLGNCGDSALLSITAAGTQIPDPLPGNIVIDNVDDPGAVGPGWSECGDPGCSGGQSTADVSFSFNQQPSRDGGSILFNVTGSAFADGLFAYNAGAYNDMANFVWDFYFQLSDNTFDQAEAIEFDFFQAINQQKYMFGTQCAYSTGVWQAWNDPAQQWVDAIPNTATDSSPTGTPIPCPKFSAGQWHHIQLFVQRRFDGRLVYGNMTVDDVTTQWNITAPSSTDPSFGDSVGIQHQLDTTQVPGPVTLQEWSDLNRITAWPQN